MGGKITILLSDQVYFELRSYSGPFWPYHLSTCRYFTGCWIITQISFKLKCTCIYILTFFNQKFWSLKLSLHKNQQTFQKMNVEMVHFGQVLHFQKKSKIIFPVILYNQTTRWMEDDKILKIYSVFYSLPTISPLLYLLQTANITP